MSRRKYCVDDFIKAIPGSGGIISTIAGRVGCDWGTVRKWIDKYPTVKAAYDSECETIGDLAESVIMRNIQLAQKAQTNADGPVDSADAKWYLSRVRRGKFATKTETDLTSGGESITFIVKKRDDDNV